MGTVLLIEDSITERTIITDFCKTLGINVTVATSGEEGLEKLHNNHPDVIVLDVVLPGKSGFEVCREIKRLNKPKPFPSFFVLPKIATWTSFGENVKGQMLISLNPLIKIFLIVPYNNF
jgi:chemotaxis family two-component system response regulator PixH